MLILFLRLAYVLSDKIAYLIQGVGGLREKWSKQRVAMDHSLPYSQGDLHSGLFSFLGEACGIIEEGIEIADRNQQGR
jgi:hypothetical protein